MPMPLRLATAFNSSSSAPLTASRACWWRSRSSAPPVFRFDWYSAMRAWSSSSGSKAESSEICSTIGRTRGSSLFASSTARKAGAAPTLHAVELLEARQHLAASTVARLATIAEDGKPHIVPMVFALEGDIVYFAVDAKPKKSTNLKRLRNIAANPAVSVLADHYEDDWTKLWWVRADGTARVITDMANARCAA